MHPINQDFLLEKSIEDNNFSRFKYLLRTCRSDINRKNTTYGDTPLLTCLKLDRPRWFIERLLSAEASIVVANDIGITPLSYAVAVNYDMAQMLLEKSAHTIPFMWEIALGSKLYEDLQRNKCQFTTFVINAGQQSEKQLLCIEVSNPIYSRNLTIMELSVFLYEVEARADECLLFNNVCASLIYDSMRHWNTASVFKTIWSRVNHRTFICTKPTLAYDFPRICKYKNFEFIECLKLLLTSKYASYFYYPLIKMKACNPSFYTWLFWKFLLRDIDKYDRISIISCSVRFANVSIGDVTQALRSFGFNEEFVILLQHFKPIPRSFQVINFIFALEESATLALNNLNKLGLIPRSCYFRLLNSVPEHLLTDTIRLKKQMLNKVPPLFELSRYAFQKHLQKFYNIKDLHKFHTVVDNLLVPSSIKNDLRHEPPIYY